MIDRLDLYNTTTNNTVISVITEDTELEFISHLKEYGFEVKILNEIPKNRTSFIMSPDTIIIDNKIDKEWKIGVQAIQKIDFYRNIPVIVLQENKISIKDVLLKSEDNFCFFQRNDTKAILHGTINMVKNWKKLNKTLIKTNELNRILSTTYLVLDTKNECLETTLKELSYIKNKVNVDVKETITKLTNKIAETLKKGDHYQLFKAHFEEVHPLFFQKLLSKSEKLTNNDLKLASFLKMGFNNDEISFFMGISIAGAKKAIQRLRKKLELKPNESLRQYIFTIEV